MLPKSFAITGVVSLGYVVFSFLCGVALGAPIGNAIRGCATGLPVVVTRLVVESRRATLVAPS
jgi:hypothetical protein